MWQNGVGNGKIKKLKFRPVLPNSSKPSLCFDDFMFRDFSHNQLEEIAEETFAGLEYVFVKL